MKKQEKNQIMTVAAIAIIAILAFAIVSQNAAVPQQTNGLTGEAGYIDSAGVTHRLEVGQTLSTVQVNGIYLNLNDWIYWRFWLNLQSSGDIQSPALTSVRFKLTQTGINPTFQAGTEGVPTGEPATSPTESWFQVSLPVGTQVAVPVQYRDNWLGNGAVDNATNPAPYTTVDTATGQAVRSARVERASDFSNWAAGTYTWTCICTIIDVAWTYTVAGQGVQVAHVQPSPSQVSFTFTIVVGTNGSLSATLSGASS